MAAGLVFILLLGLSFGLWDGADACQLKVPSCDKWACGWSWYDGRCFLFINITMTWAAAEKHCLSLDGHLASMSSTNEYNFIRELVYEESGKHTQSWVGGHDSAEEGNWLWSDGSKFLFHRWGTNEPNNAYGIENCMDINFSGHDYVNDNVCGLKLPFICAKQL